MTNYNFNLLPLNAWAIRDYFKRKSIFTWVKQQNTDKVFSQETYSTPDIENEWKLLRIAYVRWMLQSTEKVS